MAGASVSVQATGFSHPPSIKPIQRDGGKVEWHMARCQAPEGACRGCSPSKPVQRSPHLPEEWHRTGCPAPYSNCRGCGTPPKAA